MALGPLIVIPIRPFVPSIFGKAINIVPGDPTQQVEIQRADDASGTNATTIATGLLFPKSGAPYVDVRTNDGNDWFYRARHNSPGFDAGAWTSPWVGGFVKPIPQAVLAASINFGGGSVYPLIRAQPWDDTSLALAAAAADPTGLTAHANVLESGGRKINRLYAKVLAADPDSIDAVVDGATYARILGNRLASGAILRAGAFSDGSYAVVASSTDGLSAASGVKESGGKVINRLYAKVLAGDADSLDGVVDGATYARILGNRLSSGTVLRAGAFSDGSYAVVASSTDGLSSASGVKESGGKAINRLLGKALAGDADSLDGCPDGSTYQRVLSVSSGLVQQASLASSVVNRDKTDSANRMKCRAYFSTGTVSINNNTLTKLNFDIEEFDTASLHDLVTNPDRITIPASGTVTGVWIFVARVDWAAGATGYRYMEIDDTFGSIAGGDSRLPPGAAQPCYMNAYLVVNDPAHSDHYAIQVQHTQGAALNLIGGSPLRTGFAVTHLW